MNPCPNGTTKGLRKYGVTKVFGCPFARFKKLMALDMVTDATHDRQGIAACCLDIGRWHSRKVASMMNKAMIKVMVLGTSLLGASLGVIVVAAPPSLAQSSLGGPTKPKQNALGGAAKPGPVIGGAATPNPVVTKPPAVGGVTKLNTVGSTPAPGSIGNGATPGPAGGVAKQNPPVIPPNKGGTVVTTSSNLKCAAGACVVRGAKP